MFLPYLSTFLLRITFSYHRPFILYSISSVVSHSIFLRTSSLQSIFQHPFCVFSMQRTLILHSTFFFPEHFSFTMSSTSECLFQSDLFLYQHIVPQCSSSGYFLSRMTVPCTDLFLLIFLSSSVCYPSEYIPSPAYLFIISLVSFRLPSVLSPVRLLAIFLVFLHSFLLQYIFSVFSLSSVHTTVDFPPKFVFTPKYILPPQIFYYISYFSVESSSLSPSPFTIFLRRIYRERTFTVYFPSRVFLLSRQLLFLQHTLLYFCIYIHQFPFTFFYVSSSSLYISVFSPICLSSEYLLSSNMFRVSRSFPLVSIFDVNISLLSTCPQEYIFISVYSMSSYHQLIFSSDCFPQRMFLLFTYIFTILAVFPSEYFSFSVDLLENKDLTDSQLPLTAYQLYRLYRLQIIPITDYTNYRLY